MSVPPSAGTEQRSEAFAYFMIRLRPPGDGDPAGLSGMIERLGAGEKRSFASAEELVSLLALWPATGVKVDAANVLGNS